MAWPPQLPDWLVRKYEWCHVCLVKACPDGETTCYSCKARLAALEEDFQG